MSPITITIADATDSSKRAVMRRLGEILLALSVLFIFFQGLFPFDFTTEHQSWFAKIGSKFEFAFHGYTDRQDLLLNILFFMPFGFSLAAVVRRRSTGTNKWQAPLIAGTVASLGFSTGIELSQVFLPSRVASLSDIIANTIGGALGAGVFIAIGDLVLRPIAKQLLRWKNLITPRNMAITTAAYALAVICLPLAVTKPGNLGGWMSTLPLTVGNDASAWRPWKGLVSKIELADRAVTAEEALFISAKDTPPGNALIASYATRGTGPFVDSTGHCPPLTWTKVNPIQPENAPAMIGNGSFLRSEGNISAVLDTITKHNQFTAIIWLATTDATQTGPARILAVDDTKKWTNFIIGQEKHDLIIRVNTAQFHVRGQKPELVIGDIFPMSDMQCLILSYGGTSLSVYIDGDLRGHLDLTPETSVIRKFYPREYFQLHLDAASAGLYSVLYRILMLTPLGALIAGWIILSKEPVRNRRTAALGSLVVIVIVFEAVLAIIDPGSVHWTEPIVSILVGVGSMALVLFRHDLFWKVLKA